MLDAGTGTVIWEDDFDYPEGTLAGNGNWDLDNVDNANGWNIEDDAAEVIAGTGEDYEIHGNWNQTSLGDADFTQPWALEFLWEDVLTASATDQHYIQVGEQGGIWAAFRWAPNPEHATAPFEILGSDTPITDTVFVDIGPGEHNFTFKYDGTDYIGLFDGVEILRTEAMEDLSSIAKTVDFFAQISQGMTPRDAAYVTRVRFYQPPG